MNELTIPIDLNSKIHIYEQIYTYIKNEILEGRLTQGERLPSSRALALHLQISRSTVNLAYDQLLAEGYIEAMAYKGYFISKIEKPLRLEKTDENNTASVVEEKKYQFHFKTNNLQFNTYQNLHQEK